MPRTNTREDRRSRTSARASRTTERSAKPARAKARVARREKPAVTEGIRPIREKETWSEIKASIAEQVSESLNVEFRPKDVGAILDALQDRIVAHMQPKGDGEFSWPGFFKIVTKKYPAKVIPAIKKGTMIENKFTGVTAAHPGRPKSLKPATAKPRLRPQGKLKAAVLGG